MELEEFVQVHYGRLLRTAVLLTGEQRAGEDLLQGVLVTSWGYARRQRVEQPGPFLRRCLVNAFVSGGRRRNRFREVPTDLTELPDGLLAAPSADSEDPEARDAMWRALSGLPRHQRAVLVLRFYEGMTETQIADTLGISVGAVRSGSWRGLQRLRRTFSTTAAVDTVHLSAHTSVDTEDQNV